jgi:hypothetical protein
VCYAGGMKKSHAEVLLEQISSDVKSVLELVGAQPTLADFHRLEGKVENLGDRMDVVEAAAKDVSRDLAEHTSLPAHVAHGHA